MHAKKNRRRFRYVYARAGGSGIGILTVVKSKKRRRQKSDPATLPSGFDRVVVTPQVRQAVQKATSIGQVTRTGKMALAQ